VSLGNTIRVWYLVHRWEVPYTQRPMQYRVPGLSAIPKSPSQPAATWHHGHNITSYCRSLLRSLHESLCRVDSFRAVCVHKDSSLRSRAVPVLEACLQLSFSFPLPLLRSTSGSAGCRPLSMIGPLTAVGGVSYEGRTVNIILISGKLK
jgi:hypothetical protein